MSYVVAGYAIVLSILSSTARCSGGGADSGGSPSRLTEPAASRRVE